MKNKVLSTKMNLLSEALEVVHLEIFQLKESYLKSLRSFKDDMLRSVFGPMKELMVRFE